MRRTHKYSSTEGQPEPPPDQTITVRCPECRHRPATVTTVTTRGAYMRCEPCGHMWHHDGPLIERRRRSLKINTLRRRATDRK